MKSVPQSERQPQAGRSPRPAVLRIRRDELSGLSSASRPAPDARLSRRALAGSALLHLLAFLLLLGFEAPPPRERPAEPGYTVTLLPPQEPPDRDPPLPQPPELPPAVLPLLVSAPVPGPLPLVPPVTNPAPADLVAIVEPAPESRASRKPDAQDSARSAIRNAIHRHLAYPESARRRGEEGRVVLQVSIGSDGDLDGLDAESDGASPRLVSAALSAARRAAPFDASLAGRHAVPVVFRLQPEAGDRALRLPLPGRSDEPVLPGPEPGP